MVTSPVKVFEPVALFIVNVPVTEVVPVTVKLVQNFQRTMYRANNNIYRLTDVVVVVC